MPIYLDPVGASMSAMQSFSHMIENKRFMQCSASIFGSVGTDTNLPVIASDVISGNLNINSRNFRFKSYTIKPKSLVTIRDIATNDPLNIETPFVIPGIDEELYFGFSSIPITNANFTTVAFSLNEFFSMCQRVYCINSVGNLSNPIHVRISDNFRFDQNNIYLCFYYRITSNNSSQDITNTLAAMAQYLHLNSATYKWSYSSKTLFVETYFELND